MEDSYWWDVSTTYPRSQWVFSHPASLTFSVMCLSLLPQHGARYFPTQHLLCGDSGPSGHTKLSRGFRNCLTHTRTYIQVCEFLEMISEDGMCCRLRPDLPLRWSCWPASLSVLPHVLCTPASPTPSSYHPICAPSSLFSPDQLALSFHHGVLWLSVPLGQESV